ncbi:unnamed protein product [Moneuplotes crassus]|uniref:Uncharacterized protein n=1 Tax=Euplotes crassus TaxID=5936 RepID=A0AAD1XKC0_EUPCR|nr:unnamed protein product [Moneuplotes crassus]
MGKVYSSIKCGLGARENSSEKNNQLVLANAETRRLKLLLFRRGCHEETILFGLVSCCNHNQYKRVTSLKPRFHHLDFLSVGGIHELKERDFGPKHSCRKATYIISDTQKYIFSFSGAANILVNFSFYSRSACKAMSATLCLLKLKRLRISHKDFGRILVSVVYKCRLHLRLCKVTVNHFDYLNNARVAISDLGLFKTEIIQPEEDSEHYDGLTTKMAKSKLNSTLRQLDIYPVNYNSEGQDNSEIKELMKGNIKIKLYPSGGLD